ncbi:MAG: MBL fold metallo-hydrolase [Planctomycetota bacterium]|jgi:glyoxylase-like metal-dependent hydrolase (beta-lactamase superfamily II)
MAATLRVISIGTLAANPHWGERGAVRPAHATTSLIVSGDARILVDPSLPPQALAGRLAERAGIGVEAITHVFLTCLNPLHRRGLLAFEKAEWLVSEREREAIGVQLVASLKEAHGAGDEDLVKTLGHEIAVVQRTRPAPDRLAPGVDLFPLPGATPGLTGLLLPSAGATTLVAGDAVPTVEHLAAGQVLSPCFDLEAARESFTEAIEIADWIVCGRDNIVPNQARRF